MWTTVSSLRVLMWLASTLCFVQTVFPIVYPEPVITHTRVDDTKLVWSCRIDLSADNRRDIMIWMNHLGTAIHYQTNLATATCSNPTITNPVERYFYTCDDRQDTLTLSVTIIPVAEIDFNRWTCTYRHKTADGTSSTWTGVSDTSLITAYKLPCSGKPSIVYDAPKTILLTRPGDSRMVIGCKSENFDWACITKTETTDNTRYVGKFWSRFEFSIDGTVKKRGDLWGRLRPRLASDGTNAPWDTQKYIETGGKRDVCNFQEDGHTYINSKNQCFLMNSDHVVTVDLPSGGSLKMGAMDTAQHTVCWSNVYAITANTDILKKPLGVKTDLSQFNVGSHRHGYGKNTFPILSLNEKSDYWLLGKDSLDLRDINKILIDQPSLESFSPTVYRDKVALPFTHLLTYEKASVDVVTPAEIWANQNRNDPKSLYWYMSDTVEPPYGWKLILDEQLVRQYYTFLLKGLTTYDYVKFGFAKRVFEGTQYEMLEYDCQSGYQNTDVDAAILVMTSGSCSIDINCLNNPRQKCSNQENPGDKRCSEDGGDYQFRFIETKIGTDGITKIYKKNRPDGKRFNSKPNCASARYVCFYLKSTKPRNYAWLATPNTPQSFVSKTDPTVTYLRDLYFVRFDATIEKNECPQFEDKNFLLTESDPEHTWKNDYKRLYEPYTRIRNKQGISRFANANEGRKRLYYISTIGTENNPPIFTANPDTTITRELSVELYNTNNHHQHAEKYMPKDYYYSHDNVMKLDFKIDAINVTNSVRDSLPTAIGDDSCVKPKCQLIPSENVKSTCPCQNPGDVCVQTNGLPDLMRRVVVSTRLVESELGNGKLKCRALGRTSIERDFYEMALEFSCRSDVKGGKLKARGTDMYTIGKHTPAWSAPSVSTLNDNFYTVRCPLFSELGCTFDKRVYLVLDFEQTAGYRTVTRHVLFTQTDVMASRKITIYSLNQTNLPFGIKTFYEIPPHQYLTDQYVPTSMEHYTDDDHVFTITNHNIDGNMMIHGTINFQIEKRWMLSNETINGASNSDTTPKYTHAWCAYPNLDFIGKKVSIQNDLLHLSDRCWQDVYYSRLQTTAAQRWVKCSVLFGTSDESISCPIPEVILTIGEEGEKGTLVKRCGGNSVPRRTGYTICEIDKKRSIVKMSVKLEANAPDSTNITCNYRVPSPNTKYNPRPLPDNSQRMHGVFRRNEKKDVTQLQCYELDDSVKLLTVINYNKDSQTTEILCNLPKYIQGDLPICEGSAQAAAEVNLKAAGRFQYSTQTDFTKIVSKKNMTATECSSYMKVSGVSCNTSSTTDDNTVLAIYMNIGFTKTFLFHTKPDYSVDFSCDIGDVAGKMVHDARFNKAMQEEIASNLRLRTTTTPKPKPTPGTEKNDKHKGNKKRPGISTKNIIIVITICSILGVIAGGVILYATGSCNKIL